MNIIKITEKFSISSQPLLTDFSELKRKGFVKIINNRCDNEEPGQLTSENEREAAYAIGLEYAHIPISGRMNITDVNKNDFLHAINSSPQPVIAHCKSGARSFGLWIKSGIFKIQDEQELLEIAERLGLDKKLAANWINTLRNENL
ncbi:hypothetical protein B488_02870 [Liberibacter crescens BT-1]|uniref:Beta-lactamase hydrolase-like protein phosphatase-like domain-containing protein n=1 Tax=Liberibacter crescens (strain BT-1) TaxID=1215343 RepID=L0ETV7_LIBCB|nr:sulfur transferase domain-containing protein [Liberibacter crescens]AGA64280.1 hypothetical protein B488_02870 [Liberibacter crescens BT-1]